MLLLRLQSCCAPAARPAAPALARRCISTASGVFSAAAAAAGAAGAAGAQPALFTLPHFAAGAPPPPQPLPRGQKPSYDDPIALAMHRLRRGLPKTLHSNELLQEYYAPHAVLISRVGCAVPPHESLRGGASQTDDEHSTGGLADGAAGRGGVTIRGLPLIKLAHTTARTYIRMVLASPRLEILSLKRWPDDTVHSRWRVAGTSRTTQLPLIYLDAYSIFTIDKDGMVVVHDISKHEPIKHNELRTADRTVPPIAMI